MVDRPRQLALALTNLIKEHKLWKSASMAIGSATEKAQEKLINIRGIATEKYDVVAQQLNGSTMIQKLNVPPLQSVPKNIVVWWRWYEHLTGLDKVEIARENVILVQENLFKCQEKRRLLTSHVAVVNDKLKEIYGEIIQTKRDDPKYVQLTIMENKGLQEHSKIIGQLQLLEIEEKDCFTQLATAIKEYHDTQTANTQKYKYLSIIASALLAVISLIASMLYNNRRIKDVRNIISEAQVKNESMFMKSFHALEAKLNETKSHSTPPTVSLPETIKPIEEFDSNYVKIGVTIICIYALLRMFTG